MEKTALVTGSARRIGRSIVCDLHRRGWRVIVHCHRSEAEAVALCDELNAVREGSADTWCFGFVAGANYQGACADLIKKYPRIDALIHNAAVYYPTITGQCTTAQWDDVMESNLKSVFFLSQGLHPALQKAKGCVVHISDRVAVQHARKDYMLYELSKASLNDMAKRLAKAYAPEVRVHTVALGPTVLPEGVQLPAMQQAGRLTCNALQKSVRMTDIHEAILYLLDSAKHSTGQVLYVDGDV